MNRGIFLDRDGVLNELVYYADSNEYEAPRTPEQYTLRDGVLDALNRLRADGWLLFLVSNQPNIAKGKASLDSLNAVHHRLEERLAEINLTLQGVYYCYHHPEGIVPAYSYVCDCRKPGIGSLQRAQDSFDLDLSHCWMIGDQDSDVFCGHRAGCRTIQISYEPSGWKRGKSQPDYTCSSLSETVRIITESTLTSP